MPSGPLRLSRHLPLLLSFVLFACVSPVRRDPRYAAIDAHALSAGRAEERSLPELARYLTRNARNDTEKARAIFTWITDRVRYDTAGFFSGHYGDTSDVGTLRSRRSVCDGYASLFQALAQQVGLEVTKISGFAKGYGMFPESSMEQPKLSSNHAWNAVRIDSQWRLIDATWGAGHLRGKRFVKRFDEFYFLPDPAQLVFTHFPDDPKWQILPGPIDAVEFLRSPRPWPAYFAYGLRVVAPAPGQVVSRRAVEVRVAYPLTTELSWRLHRVRKRGMQVDSEEIKVDTLQAERSALIQVLTGELHLSGSLPEEGPYEIMIFATRAGWTTRTTYEAALSIAVP